MRKYYYGAVAFYLIALLSYITYQYTAQRSELIAKIDQELIQSASVADQFLPPSLHTPQMNASSVSVEQDSHNRSILSRFAESMSVKYVYSCILKEGKVYFTSSSATPEELKNNEGISYYYDVYDDASPMLQKAIVTRKIQFDEYADKWGSFRSVFMPHVSPTGQVYVIGSDIDVSDINNRLHILLTHSVFEALFYIIILLPFFIVYRLQNRNIQQELVRQVDERTANLNERSVAVKRLLDNSNQGFLTFSDALIVEKEYSLKCLDIFENTIENIPIGELLYSSDPHKRDFFEQTLRAVFVEEDEVKVEAILSLLQQEFIVRHKLIQVAYNRIEPNRLMLILTDITDKKNLEINVERERNRLKMIVAVISNSDEFFELLDEYQTFLSRRSSFVNIEHTPFQNLTELYRLIHTYKGLFAQKDFITTPQGLHKVESRFSLWLHDETISNETIQAMLTKIDFESWLNKDIDVLRETLGDEFMDKKSTITIDDETFEILHGKIKELIETQPDECHELSELLEDIRKLKYKPIGEYFASLPKYVEMISKRLEKSLKPMGINDATNITVGEEFKPFAKSLIHVIRNSVDHGIETPEERVENGKNEYGTILLSITDTEESVVIEISDDGRGINKEKLKQKALERGCKTPLELENDSAVFELMFEDFLSTKDEISDLSGRGVGLASVRSEVLKLGGSYSVVSEQGKGCRFIFSIPKKSLVRDEDEK